MRAEPDRPEFPRRSCRAKPWFGHLWPARLLPIVIVWLGIAIILKSAIVVGSAFAQQPTQAAIDRTAGGATAAASTDRAVPHTKTYWPVSNWTDRPPPPPSCKPNPLSELGETATLLDLRSRAQVLHARALALDRQQQALDATQAALREQVAAMKPLVARLESLKVQRQSVDDAKWSALVETYGAMEPRSAARIFDGLDPGIVFNVLRRMNNRKSAAILASMAPDKAQTITERLAGEPAVPAVQPTNALLPDGAP